MTTETHHDYHLRRARAELDLAYRAQCHMASEAHLRLSSLHMQRLNDPEAEVRSTGLQAASLEPLGDAFPWHDGATPQRGEMAAASG